MVKSVHKGSRHHISQQKRYLAVILAKSTFGIRNGSEIQFYSVSDFVVHVHVFDGIGFHA